MKGIHTPGFLPLLLLVIIGLVLLVITVIVGNIVTSGPAEIDSAQMAAYTPGFCSSTGCPWLLPLIFLVLAFLIFVLSREARKPQESKK